MPQLIDGGRLRRWLRRACALGLVLLAAQALPAMAQDVNLAIGELHSGGAITIEFLATVDQPVSVGATEVCNQGSIEGDNFTPDVLTDDPSQAGAADPTCTPLSVPIDLVVTKTESADPVVAGSGAGNLTYVVTVLNASADIATGVLLNEAMSLPAGVTLDSVTPSGATSFDGMTSVWTVGTLNPGASESLTVVLTVAATAAAGTDAICNTATVTGIDQTPVNTADDAATECTSIARQVDLAVSKSESADPVTAGSGAGNLTYTVSVTNAGPSDASGVTLSEVLSLPAGVGVVSVTPSAGSFADPVWTLGDLASGASASLTVVLTAGSGATHGASVCDTATVTGANETLVNTGDDAATECTTVARQVDLIVTKSESADPVVAGAGTLTHVVTVANAGPSDASAVSVSDVLSLPAGVTVDAITPSQGGFTDPTWSVGTLTAGASATLTVTLAVAPSTVAGTDVICDTATLTGAAEALINTGDDAAGECTSVSREFDLIVSKSESVDPVIAGSGAGNLSYVVTVDNAGPSDASGVSVSETLTLPAGVTADSITPSQGGFADPAWSLGDLAAGASATLTVVLTADATAAPGTDVICDTATITATDPSRINTGDDSATECTSVTLAADLSITKVGDANPPAAGDDLTYTLTVENLGASDATGVVVTDTLPAAVSYVSDTCGGADVPPWTWSIGSLAAGASVACDVVVSINPAPPVSISNTAAVTGDQFDPDLDNNQATEVTTLDNVPPDVATVDTVPSRGGLLTGQTVTSPVTGFTLVFTEAVQNTGGGAGVDDAGNPANYLLVGAGADGTIQTASCLAGPVGDDTLVPIVAAAYEAVGFTTTLDLGQLLPAGTYRLFACGSTTIRDLAGNPLCGGVDVQLTFTRAFFLEIPTVGQAGLLSMIGVLMLIGLWRLRRQPHGRLGAGLALLLLSGVVAGLPGRSEAQVIIDDFTTAQGPNSVPGSAASTADSGGADILGNERDMVVLRSAGAGAVSAEVTGGELVFTAAAATTGELILTWDGNDDDAAALNPTGLGGVDLTAAGTQGGLRLRIEQARAGTYLLLSVYEDADHVSRAARVLPAIAAPTEVFIDFSELQAVPGAVGPADLTSVGAITVLVGGRDTDPAPTLRLSEIATAAPAIAALKVDRTPAGDPIAGAVQPAETLRYRITVTNPGAGAEGVDVADLLSAIPNLSLVGGSLRATPLARRDAYRALVDTPLDSAAETLPSLLANDVHPTGGALTAVAVTAQATAQGGVVDIATDGHLVYTPASGFVGVDAFDYALAAIPGDPSTDAAGNPIGAITGTAVVIIERVPPTVSAGGTLAYTENDAATAIDTGLTLSDPDSPNLAGATVQITGNYAVGEDVLSFVDTVNITGLWNAPSATLTLSGSDTLANYQSALRSVRYANGSEAPDTLDRTVTWIVNDGVLASPPATSTITVTALNDVPVVTAGSTLAYTEGDAPTAIDGGIFISDPDSTTLAGATAQISANYVNGEDELSFTNMLGITGNWNAASGTLTLSGAASVANYQTALRSIAYENTSVAPSELTRTVTWVVDDGEAANNLSTAVSSFVEVTAVNSAPALTTNPVTYTTAGNTQLEVAGATLAGVARITDAQSAFTKAAPTDADGPGPLAVIAAAGASTNGGSFSIDSAGDFSYLPPVGFTGVDSFTYQVTDNGTPAGVAVGTVQVTVSETVWYVRDVVDADNPAGGDGRSNNAFETTAAAAAALTPEDYLFVFAGNSAATPYSDEILINDTGVKLHGEGVGLTVPGFGTLVPAGTRPRLVVTANNAGEDNAVTVEATAGSLTGVEIRGLDLTGRDNGIDVTATGANTVGVTISDNTIQSDATTGLEGVDINLDSTGASTLAFHDNLLTAGTMSALDAQEIGTGSLTITAFHDNQVSGNSFGGLVVNNATFDASTTTAGIQPVPGGDTDIGDSGNPVAGAGLHLFNVTGALNFANVASGTIGAGDLDIYSAAALVVGGLGGFEFDVTPGAGTLVANSGAAAALGAADVDLQLGLLTSTNSPGAGVSLSNVSGTFSAPSGSTITDAGVTDFVISGSTAAVTYGGTIVDDVGQLVVVNGSGGAAKLFTGAITDGDDGDGGGISLTGNSATISFSGALTLSTGANAAFTATGGGTVTATDATSKLTTTTGTPLTVTTTNIGAAGLRFASISSNGAVNGVVLNGNTGSTGRLVVGPVVGGACNSVATCAGGAIQNSTGAAISLTNTRNVSFTEVYILNGATHGILGTTMADATGGVHPTFELKNSFLDSPGDADNESAIYFDSPGVVNISGRMVVSDTTIQNFEDVGVHVGNNSGTVAIELTNLNIDNNSDTNGEEGVDVEALGTANITLDVSGGTFNNLEGGGFNVFVSSGSGSIDLDIDGTTITGTGGPDNFPTPPAITLSAEGGSSTFTFDITNNDILDSSGDGIFVGHEGSIMGRITGNDISGMQTGDGIRLDSDATGSNTMTILIDGNNIGNVVGNTGIGDDGIQELHRDGTKQLNLTISNNQIANTASEGIRYFADDDVAGGGPGNNVRIAANTFTNIGVPDTIVIISQDPGTEVCTHTTGNTLTGVGVPGITLQQSGSAVLQITQASTAALSAANEGATVTPVGTITFNGPCTTTPQPTN